MIVLGTDIGGVYTISRGTFSRIFCKKVLKEVIGNRIIMQSSLSRTQKVGAIRGMHYQRSPHGELKIIRCLRGKVFDVAVDLRAGSSTFLRWVGVELSPGKGNALIVPEGFAHGYQVLEPESELLYFHTEFYEPSSEGSVRYDDPMINIKWPLSPTDLSIKDSKCQNLTSEFKGIKL